jgi:hypothetical protein
VRQGPEQWYAAEQKSKQEHTLPRRAIDDRPPVSDHERNASLIAFDFNSSGNEHLPSLASHGQRSSLSITPRNFILFHMNISSLTFMKVEKPTPPAGTLVASTCVSRREAVDSNR